MGADWPGLPTPLWNHAACAVESVPSYKLFCFGGQKAEFVYSSTVSVLDTARKVSSSTAISGTTPTPTLPLTLASTLTLTLTVTLTRSGHLPPSRARRPVQGKTAG